ncbi:hypothetical protein AGMMS49992_12370 [Clostridia bacterium]|nr:hypothetical protein AGMMS49992_12370 [Clostridia bacterium]
MTELLFSAITMPTVSLGKENPTPDFDSGILPYTMLDGYGRKREPRSWKAVILRNDYIEALFLPQLGGRLWSLTDRTNGRDLLYNNPEFQPIDRSARNAWVPGGVEWNCGLAGHSAYTVSPLFAEAIEPESGAPILRMYQYERVHDLVYQISAVLPNDSHHLFVHIRVDNASARDTTLCWSDCMMVNAEPDTCLLVRARRNQRKWAASIGADGYGLIQTSTDTLSSRIISEPEQEGAYLTIQAGLTRVVSEQLPLEGNGKREWTEAYGSIQLDPDAVSEDAAEGFLEKALPRARVEAMDAALADGLPGQRGRLILKGGGWGSLEQVLRWEDFHSQGLRFPSSSMTLEQREWQDLVFAGALPNRDPSKPPIAIQVSDGWMERVIASIENGMGDHWYSHYMLGVMYAYRSDSARAEAAFMRSMALTPNQWAERCLELLHNTAPATAIA